MLTLGIGAVLSLLLLFLSLNRQSAVVLNRISSSIWIVSNKTMHIKFQINRSVKRISLAPFVFFGVFSICE